MVKEYVFWGLFALVLIGIGITLWDRHRRAQRAKALEAAYRAGAASAAHPGAGPAAHPPADRFDPNATRVHFRDAADGVPHAAPHRDAAPLPPRKAARLVCVGGSQKEHSFAITAGGIIIGRDPNNDVVITDSRASFHHAWIGIVDHKVVLRDLGSTNGTFLNAAIDEPVGEVELSPGDTIFFGGHGRDQFRLVVD